MKGLDIVKKILFLIFLVLIIFFVNINVIKATSYNFFRCYYGNSTEWVILDFTSNELTFVEATYLPLFGLFGKNNWQLDKEASSVKNARIETGGNYISQGICPPSVDFKRPLIGKNYVIIYDNDSNGSLTLGSANYDLPNAVVLECSYEIEKDKYVIKVYYDNRKAYNRIRAELWRNLDGNISNVSIGTSSKTSSKIKEEDFYGGDTIEGDASCPPKVYYSSYFGDFNQIYAEFAAFNMNNVDQNKLQYEVKSAQYVSKTIFDNISIESIEDYLPPKSNKSIPIQCEDFNYEGTNIIREIYKIIMIIAPILVILFGSLDFAKATFASDEEAMRKTQTNFLKRMIAAIILFLLPYIVSIMLEVAFNVGIPVPTPIMCIFG